MDAKISIEPHLIWRITRLSKKGLDLALVFIGKMKDKQSAQKINKEYKVTKLGKGYDVKSIQDERVSFATQLLAAKLLQKCHHNQVPAPVISLASKCVEVVVYNWATFLLNEFIEDCKEAQD